ncbi:MAG: hypothetical protein WBD58_02580 [Geitlerinemataceae cyanobacterium]
MRFLRWGRGERPVAFAGLLHFQETIDRRSYVVPHCWFPGV